MRAAVLVLLSLSAVSLPASAAHAQDGVAALAGGAWFASSANASASTNAAAALSSERPLHRAVTLRIDAVVYRLSRHSPADGDPLWTETSWTVEMLCHLVLEPASGSIRPYVGLGPAIYVETYGARTTYYSGSRATYHSTGEPKLVLSAVAGVRLPFHGSTNTRIECRLIRYHPGDYDAKRGFALLAGLRFLFHPDEGGGH